MSSRTQEQSTGCKHKLCNVSVELVITAYVVWLKKCCSCVSEILDHCHFVVILCVSEKAHQIKKNLSVWPSTVVFSLSKPWKVSTLITMMLNSLHFLTRWFFFFVMAEELSAAVLSHSSLYFCWKKLKNGGSGQLREQPEGLAAAEPDSTKLHTGVELGFLGAALPGLCQSKQGTFSFQGLPEIFYLVCNSFQ